MQLGQIADDVLNGMVVDNEELDEVRVVLDDPDLASDHALDRKCRLFVDATEDRLAGGLHHSYTCDKSRVGILGLMNGFITDPTNPGCWAVPQAICFWTVSLMNPHPLCPKTSRSGGRLDDSSRIPPTGVPSWHFVF